jgi:hypothetical protein
VHRVLLLTAVHQLCESGSLVWLYTRLLHFTVLLRSGWCFISFVDQQVFFVFLSGPTVAGFFGTYNFYISQAFEESTATTTRRWFLCCVGFHRVQRGPIFSGLHSILWKNVTTSEFTKSSRVYYYYEVVVFLCLVSSAFWINMRFLFQTRYDFCCWAVPDCRAFCKCICTQQYW